MVTHLSCAQAESKRFLKRLGLDTASVKHEREPPHTMKRSHEDPRKGLTNWREIARGLRRWSTPTRGDRAESKLDEDRFRNDAGRLKGTTGSHRCDLEAMLRDTVGTKPFSPAARVSVEAGSRRRPGGPWGALPGPRRRPGAPRLSAA